MKLYWFNKICCVPGCTNSSTEGEGCFKEYFDLPAEPTARGRWLKAVLVEDNENLKVCEDHFKVQIIYVLTIKLLVLTSILSNICMRLWITEDEDVFRDKNNRKKLRLNSVPSTKLPEHICTTCLGSKFHLPTSPHFQLKLCRCGVTTPNVLLEQQTPPNKRTHLKWSTLEKKTLFKAIRQYGDIRFGNNNIRINWANVLNNYRSNGCFGNEKELKVVWQNMRTNALKIYKNEIYGSKLDRKIARFLFGKSPQRIKTKNKDSNKDASSTDEEPLQETSMCKIQEDKQECNGTSAIEHSTLVTQEAKEKTDASMCDSNSDSDDSQEYYSITDIEDIFEIKIRPEPSQVISLVSSDDDQ
ncbi:hypothetical protein ABEB36_013270 [Hypothenemus hampei]|uniref:THAP-type domain-containing protein n=1 Tax=Hypothenemus hampei TaxID=57062 RepID=A0ABD1E8B9_HYPHA